MYYKLTLLLGIFIYKLKALKGIYSKYYTRKIK